MKRLRKVQLSSSDKEQSTSEESHRAGDKGAAIGAENTERRGARLEGEEHFNYFCSHYSFVVQRSLHSFCTEGPDEPNMQRIH